MDALTQVKCCLPLNKNQHRTTTYSQSQHTQSKALSEITDWYWHKFKRSSYSRFILSFEDGWRKERKPTTSEHLTRAMLDKSKNISYTSRIRRRNHDRVVKEA